MTLTGAFCAADSTAASSAPDPFHAGSPGGVCAIHQPNLFPRLSTLAKLYAADRWIVLDDVQFARRDYQHRARFAALNSPVRQQWLTLPTHLPEGRPTLISQARLADPNRSRRTVSLLIRQHYGRSRHWIAVRGVLDAVLDQFETTDRVCDVARTSMIALLNALGWSGEVLDSSMIPTREGRSERLADLAEATSSTHYLCGTGGWRYLDPAPFDAHGIPVLAEISSLWALSQIEPESLAAMLAAQRDKLHRGVFT